MTSKNRCSNGAACKCMPTASWILNCLILQVRFLVTFSRGGNVSRTVLVASFTVQNNAVLLEDIWFMLSDLAAITKLGAKTNANVV